MNVSSEARTKQSLSVVLFTTLAALVLLWFKAPKTDPVGYLDFVDTRALFGIANAWNVFSNLPFLVVGVLGLRLCCRRLKTSPELSWAGLTLSIALVMTTAGSSYFHLHPSTETLFWDRLPMSIAFMATLSLIVADRLHSRFGFRLLPVLIGLGIWSVIHWRFGSGDLRPYILVQYGGLVAILVVLFLTPDHRLKRQTLLFSLGCYGLAKVFEVTDGAFYQITHGWVSGHSIKHLAAAMGAGLLLFALKRGLEVST